jgi:hypothetical protein
VKAGGIAFAVVAVGTAVGLVWLLFQVVWNAVVPAVFHGPTLSYWQAAGICFLLGFITNRLARSE